MMIRSIVTGLIMVALLSVPVTGVAFAAAGGPQGMTLPPGMTIGPYSKVIPAGDMPKVVPGPAHTTLFKKLPGGPMGYTLPPGMTIGPYGKVIPASNMPKVVSRAVTGPQGMTLPPGMTIGPYSKVIPASRMQAAT